MADLLSMTNSCTRPRIWTGKQRHCGVCSQCIDRRFAVLAAGMDEHDPAENYMRDLLFADRSADGDMRMALLYVSFFQRVGATSKERFLVDFPEVVSALDRFTGLSPDEAGDRVAKHARALYRNELPAGSLLAICFSREHVEAAPASDYDAQTKAFIDQLSSPVLEFAIDRTGKRVLFRGGHALDGANFRIVEALIDDFRKSKAEDMEVPLLPPTSLADQLRISDQSMRQQLQRLREALEPLAVNLGIPLDQNTFIETKERAGYRLNPELREVSVAAIKTDHPLPSRVWQPQMEGGKAARELPAIVDQVITMSLLESDGDDWRHEPSKGQVRRLVCRSGNPYGLPAKDRSGRLDLTEPPDLGALLAKINRTARSA